MPPGDPPGELKMRLGSASGKRRKKNEFGWFAKLSFCSFFAIFGSPLGSLKPPEIDFFLKKTFPGNAILSIFAANCVHLDFLDDFSSILNEI